MNDSHAVVEISENKLIGFHPARNEQESQEIFESLVREYGVEPYGELDGIFESEDGYTVMQTWGQFKK